MRRVERERVQMAAVVQKRPQRLKGCRQRALKLR